MKKTSILSLLFIFVLQLLTFAQVNTILINQKTFGGNNIDFLNSASIIVGGDFLVGGYSFSGISGDKVESNNGNSDYWVLNFNTALSNNWQKNIGGDSSDVLFKVLGTSDGGFFCGGMSSSTVSGSKTSPKIGRYDFWVIKYDSSGNLVWQNSYGGTDIDALVDIIELADGNFILGGRSSSPISGTKTENSRGGSDYWIVKIDVDGNVLWDKTFGGDQTEILTNVQLDEFENIYLSGTSNSAISGEKTENGYGINDIWIVKLNSNGVFIWDKTVGGDSQDDNGYISILNSNLYILSNSVSSISGTKTENSKGQSDYWVTKMDLNGTIIWDKTIGGSWYDIPKSLRVTNDKQLLLSGYSWSGISGDKTEPTNGIYDYWLVSIDTSANILWQKTIGGSDWDQLSVTLEISDNHYLLVGDSKSNISGDKTESSRGQEDYWLVEISSTISVEELSDNNISVFPNPCNEQISIQFKSANNSSKVINIYDTAGKLVHNLTTKNEFEILDLFELKNGLYIIEVLDNNITSKCKIIKK